MPEAEFRLLVKEVANYVRFLAEAGVTFLEVGQEDRVLAGDTADASELQPPAPTQPPAQHTSKAVRRVPETGANPVPTDGDEQALRATPEKQRLLHSQPKSNDENLTRSATTCNQTLAREPQFRQDSLFGEAAAPLPAADVSLEAIRNDIGDCRRCKLAHHRTHIVFGEGSPQARLVFVGEGPGAEEDATGRPFVGRAGQLLDKIIAAMGLKREEVYICNVVKCRPPENRTPERDEVAACAGFLHRQLAVIRPRVIVALGASAAAALLEDPKLGGISKLRGRFYDYRGIPLMPTFHPAYLLRSPDKKREAWEDMKQVMAKLRESERAAP